MSPKSIAVGSKNPVKIKAALAAFRQMFHGIDFEATGFPSDSGVSDQPMSSHEALTGAINRAQAAMYLSRAEYSVGIEGGIEIINNAFFANAWIVVIDAHGHVGQARSGSFALPPRVQELVESGVELGHANDQVFNEHNSKQAGGAVGSLTNGLITRQCLYEHAMTLALIPFRQRALFEFI